MVGEYSVPTANAGLSQIVSDPADGNLWFVEAAADKVGRINPTTKFVAEFAVPTAGAAPETIAVDKGGNIWFIESKASKIAELSPNNPSQITEYGVAGLTPLAPTVVGEQPEYTQKTNKKGKKVGKPVLSGFELDYSTAMNPMTAGITSNYTVTSAATSAPRRSVVPCTSQSASRRPITRPRTPSS